MQWLYLSGLLFALSGLAIIDWRYKLAFWHNARRASLTIGIAFFFFLLWDFLAILLGIFKHGTSSYALPFTIAAEFPLEEIFFLLLIVYSALILYTGGTAWRSRTSR